MRMSDGINKATTYLLTYLWIMSRKTKKTPEPTIFTSFDTVYHLCRLDFIGEGCGVSAVFVRPWRQHL